MDTNLSADVNYGQKIVVGPETTPMGDQNANEQTEGDPALVTRETSGQTQEELEPTNEEGGFFSDLWDGITDFGESAVNWISGNGFKTDEEITSSARIAELGDQAIEDFIKGEIAQLSSEELPVFRPGTGTEKNMNLLIKNLAKEHNMNPEQMKNLLLMANSVSSVEELGNIVKNRQPLITLGGLGWTDGFQEKYYGGETSSGTQTPDRSLTNGFIDDPIAQQNKFYDDLLGLPTGSYGGSAGTQGKSKVIAGLKDTQNRLGYEDGYMVGKGGTTDDGQKYNTTLFVKDEVTGKYYEVYRNYNWTTGELQVVGSKELSSQQYSRGLQQKGAYQTQCNFLANNIALEVGAMPINRLADGTEAGTRLLSASLARGEMKNQNGEYVALTNYQDAEKLASSGNFVFAITSNHIVTLAGGYTGGDQKGNLNVVRAGTGVTGLTTLRYDGPNFTTDSTFYYWRPY